MQMPTSAAALTLALPSPDGTIASAAKSGDDKRIQATAQEFEAVFLAQMVSHMFAGLGSSGGMFGGGPSEETYKAMLYQEIGKTLAKAGGIGIADSVARHMLKIQESQTS